jgi:hypothetical protein
MKGRFSSNCIYVFILLSFCLCAGPAPASPSYCCDYVDKPERNQCTSACIVNNGYAVLAANYDSAYYEGLIYVNKRHVKKSNRYMDPTETYRQPFEWTSKYASLTFTVAGYQFPWCGMNEKGLAFSTMALELHEPPNDARAYMDSNFWWQYILDTCETIDEIEVTDSLVRIWTVDHFLVTDRYGDRAVIEFVNGHMVVYRDGDLPVAALTNGPYAADVDIWSSIKHTSDSYSDLSDSSQRFCLAADMVDDFRSTTDQGAVDYAYSILNAVTWGGKGAWAIVFDTKNMLVYYRTDRDPVFRYIDFYNFDFSCRAPVKMLQIQNNYRNEISEHFFDIDWDMSIEYALDFREWYGDQAPQELVDLVINSIRGFSCTEDKRLEGVWVSSDSGKTIDDLRCALNPKTGSVLVTWNVLNPAEASYGQVKSAILFRTLDGSYSSAEFHTLSDGKSYNGNPYPVYLAAQDKFLVVWDQADPAKPNGTSAVLGRVLSSRGLPEDKIVTVASGKKRNEAPQVYERPAGTTTPAKKGSGTVCYMVYFSAQAGKQGLSRPTLSIAAMNDKYQAGKPESILKTGTARINNSILVEKVLPVGMGSVVGQNIFIPVEHEMIQDNGSMANQPKIVAIGADCLPADVETIGALGSSNTRLSAFTNSEGATIVVGSTISDGVVTNDVFSAPGGTPSLIRFSTTAERLKSVDAIQLIFSPLANSSNPSGKTTTGYQFFASSKGAVFQREITESGLTSGGYKKAVKRAKGIEAVTGTEIPPADVKGGPTKGNDSELLIIWHTTSAKGDNEIRAAVMAVKR